MGGVIAAAGLAALAGCGAAGAGLDEATLERQLHALSSISVEAAFVASEAQARHLTRGYVAAHLESLMQDAVDARRELARPASPPLAQRQHAAQVLAAQLTDTLRDIVVAEGESAARLREQERLAARLKGEFDALRGKT